MSRPIEMLTLSDAFFVMEENGLELIDIEEAVESACESDRQSRLDQIEYMGWQVTFEVNTVGNNTLVEIVEVSR